jgi:hypothetical protein
MPPEAASPRGWSAPSGLVVDHPHGEPRHSEQSLQEEGGPLEWPALHRYGPKIARASCAQRVHHDGAVGHEPQERKFQGAWRMSPPFIEWAVTLWYPGP